MLRPFSEWVGRGGVGEGERVSGGRMRMDSVSFLISFFIYFYCVVHMKRITSCVKFWETG